MRGRWRFDVRALWREHAEIWRDAGKDFFWDVLLPLDVPEAMLIALVGVVWVAGWQLVAIGVLSIMLYLSWHDWREGERAQTHGTGPA